VEGVVERDELVLGAGGVQGPTDLAGELDSGLVGLGSGVGDENLRRITHSPGRASLFDQQLTQSTGPGVVVEIGSVNEGLGL